MNFMTNINTIGILLVLMATAFHTNRIERLDEETEPTDEPTEPTDEPTEPTDEETEPTEKEPKNMYDAILNSYAKSEKLLQNVMNTTSGELQSTALTLSNKRIDANTITQLESRIKKLEDEAFTKDDIVVADLPEEKDEKIVIQAPGSRGNQYTGNWDIIVIPNTFGHDEPKSNGDNALLRVVTTIYKGTYHWTVRVWYLWRNKRTKNTSKVKDSRQSGIKPSGKYILIRKKKK
jgi:hypothetical protein